MTNAGIMKEGLEASGLKVYGGVNAPYLWVKTFNRSCYLNRFLLESSLYYSES